MEMMMMMMPQLLLLIFLLGSVSATFNADGYRELKLKATEEGYRSWVSKMGSLRHSVFQKAENGLKPCCRNIKVDKDQRFGDFASVQKAIDSIPAVNLCRVVISISAGIYREKVVIPATKAYVSLEGTGADETIIEWDDTADHVGQTGRPVGTFGSATFAVDSPYFIAKNITFENKAPLPPSGVLGKQAVALRISADTAAFIGCKFIGAQDTLYDHIGRHYFKDCYIQGSVDFIFGNGLSLYEGCHLHAITAGVGALTAQKRDSLLEDTGFSFVHCKVTGSGALYLGRAWGTFSRVVFSFTYMDKIINPTGWYDWGNKSRDLTVFFGQYRCSGPGADFGRRVSWSKELTQQEAKPFLSIGFVDGHEWLTNL